nr:hypothetical protein [Tanacetum cinerariifolium]
MLIMVTIVHIKLRLSIRSSVIIKTLISRKIFKMSHNNILVVMIAGLLMTLTNSPVIHQPPQELSIQEMEDLKQQYLDELQRLSNLEYRDEIKIAKLKEKFNGMSIEIRKKGKASARGADYTSAITPDEPVLSTEEPDNSLSMGDEHLDTISAMESDEFIESGVENLIPIPSESKGIPEHVCDVPSHDNSPPLDVSKDQIEDFFESNKEFSSIDDDSFSIDDVDYVEASPPDSELVSSEVIEIVILELTDELIPFISAPEYDCFLFKDKPNSKDFTKDVVETISPTKEPQVLTVLPPPPPPPPIPPFN